MIHLFWGFWRYSIINYIVDILTILQWWEYGWYGILFCWLFCCVFVVVDEEGIYIVDDIVYSSIVVVIH